jgi:cobyrinic acid a,c-diamide synthase
MSAIPRVVVAAPSSGHGKTAVAVGLLAALRDRGLRTAGFKIGPDYIDAAYLGLAAGSPARNLDPCLVGSDQVVPLFAHGAEGAEIAVVEGTMGLYDGLAGRTDVESTAQLAASLRAPVVLVVDVAAMGQSVAALVHGFRAYDEVLWMGGVILNRVASDRHEELLREALDDVGVPVHGALRRNQLADLGLPSRSQGVAPVVARSLEARRAVRLLGEVMTASVDLDRILALGRSAPSLPDRGWSADGGEQVEAAMPPGTPERPVRPVVAVAGGPEYGYGYQETVELLEAAGARVEPVDPLRDEQLPPGTSGLVIGGGLPETYLDDLAGNASLARAVRALAEAGAPIVAEGTGLALLLREYDGRPMAGVLNAAGRSGPYLVLGYRQATARSVSPFVPAGTPVVGYRQHRGIATPRAGADPAWSWPGGEPEGFVLGRVHASYLCLHWAGIPGIARRFVRATGDAASLRVAA